MTRAGGGAASRAKPGRRPGNPDTRAAIVEAAKDQFVAHGFDKTSFRGIAKAAGVDPALVHHYFESKDDLFLESLSIPFDPRRLIPEMVGDGGVGGLGAQIAARFVAIWDDTVAREPLVALLKASATSEVAAELLRNGIARMVMGPISAELDQPDGPLRADFVASQLIGLAMVRYVLRLEPIASADGAEIAARLGPTLQRYLDGPAAHA